MEIGKKIAEIRKLKGKTQEEMAVLLNLKSKVSYGKIERDEISPTLQRLKEIANILDVNIAQFFYKEDPGVFSKEMYESTKEKRSPEYFKYQDAGLYFTEIELNRIKYSIREFLEFVIYKITYEQYYYPQYSFLKLLSNYIFNKNQNNGKIEKWFSDFASVYAWDKFKIDFPDFFKDLETEHESLNSKFEKTKQPRKIFEILSQWQIAYERAYFYNAFDNVYVREFLTELPDNMYGENKNLLEIMDKKVYDLWMEYKEEKSLS